MTRDEYSDLLTKLALFHEDGHNPLKSCSCQKAYQAVYEAMVGQEVERLFDVRRNSPVYGFTFPPETTDGNDSP